jgi:hypothetical protein
LLKIQNNGSLLTKDEIKSIFFDYNLYLSKSFYIIDKNKKEYNEDNHSPDFQTHIRKLQEASDQGRTIVVKNMEFFNSEIQEAAEELGAGTDCHLYLVSKKEEGDSFDWHTDDRPVWVKMIFGEKLFSVKSQIGETNSIDYYKLKDANSLYIGLKEHKATPIGPSAMLSFGLPNLKDS